MGYITAIAAGLEAIVVLVLLLRYISATNDRADLRLEVQALTLDNDLLAQHKTNLEGALDELNEEYQAVLKAVIDSDPVAAYRGLLQEGSDDIN